MSGIGDAVDIGNTLATGGVEVVLALLLIAIGALLVERIRLLKKASECDERVREAKQSELDSIKEIIEKFHQGNQTLSQTLVKIEVVLQAIQMSIGSREK